MATGKKIIVWGTPEFALPALRILTERGLVKAVVTQPDRPQGRGHKVLPSPVKRYALSAGLPVIQPANRASLGEELAPFLPATFFVIAYGNIIPEKILRLSELPALNIHPSLLPELRGPSPIQTALLEGRTVTGVSLIQLDAEMDHGPVAAHETVKIDASDTYVSLSEKLSSVAARLAQRFMPEYLAGKTAARPQEHEKASYSKMIASADGLLDLTQPAEILHNRIRALNPWPSTYITVRGERLKILEARPVPGTDKEAFSRGGHDVIRVRCGTGILEVMTVQLAGGRPVAARDFLNGHASLLGLGR